MVILHQYTYIDHGKTIHSSGKLESFNCDVNDKCMKVLGGTQRVTTQEGFTIPIDIISGLPYVNARTYTDKEWKLLLHVILNSDIIWDSTILDDIILEDGKWFDSV